MNKLLLPLTEVKGIGEDSAALLTQIGLVTIRDLLEYYPFRYEDYTLKDISEVKHGERVTIEGRVHSEPSLSYYGHKKSRLMFRLFVGSHLVSAVCFNQAYLKNKISINQAVTITGKWDQGRAMITVNELRLTNNVSQAFVPVYSTRGDLTAKGIKRFISLAYKQYKDYIEETLPQELLQRYKLLNKKDAIRAVHFPNTQEEVKQVRRRIVYEEFLLFQLKMQALRKYEREQSKGAQHSYDEDQLDAFKDALPFPLTNAQNRVLQEILNDMKSPYHMSRLLQGDVGSGKTVVAAICMYASVLSGNQGALMVPTEILAEQHFSSLTDLLLPFGIKLALLTSSTKTRERRETLQQLVSGEIDIIIGTHSLIQDEVNFKNLGLVITDEQHRFGVEQRRVLRQKGGNPDVLFMTATPIPRTLAITAFGEMDVSVIDELPAGRKKIETYWAKHHMLDRVLSFIEKELTQGKQAYVICPLIEESDKLDVQNALDVHATLTQYYRGKYEIGLLHGRMNSAEKDDVMRRFEKNEVHVLVSTTVVEVGVNVPNATVMLIYDAERFGLAQLHQLRGRVGRGQDQSYCILLADPKTEIGQERMRIMTETNDGFIVSEKDLELRGPGDFFGKKQSGVPEFKMADVVHDYRALETARHDATLLIQSEAFWKDSEFEALRLEVIQSGALEGEKFD
ncbi:ATP-dependent DNA helicase RecG [Bacillus sp. HMF5848]|uniref:ATP-dependent DNA helicase RecG n=1 Tax=Bacillus sp. HMF5848 TaxID=2495421 RepID=UPI0021ADCB0F|nr:ATP-dependent DNA helicase RecG [Bacillus sp. HMF5848]